MLRMGRICAFISSHSNSRRSKGEARLDSGRWCLPSRCGATHYGRDASRSIASARKLHFWTSRALHLDVDSLPRELDSAEETFFLHHHLLRKRSIMHLRSEFLPIMEYPLQKFPQSFAADPVALTLVDQKIRI
jgi:hypothetical protein